MSGKNDCIVANDHDGTSEKEQLLEEMQRMKREMEQMRQQMQKQQEVIQTKFGNKTLTCAGCNSPVEDKRSFWCPDCHGEIKFAASDIMDDSKHTNPICTECAIHVHGRHNLRNYLQELILSCSADFGEMAKKTQEFGENWPPNACSISEYLTKFFGKHFSKAEEMSVKCVSRSAFQEFNEKSHEVFMRAERSIDKMRRQVVEFVEEMEACGKECEALRSRDELFADTEGSKTATTVLDSLKSPLPTWGQQGRIWQVGRKLAPEIKFNYVSAHQRNLFAFSQNKLFRMEMNGQGNANGPIIEIDNEIFNGIYTATSIPDDTKIVFATERNREEFVVFDFKTRKILQKIKVEADILDLDCSRTEIAVTTISYKILLFSCNGVMLWRKVQEIQGCLNGTRPRMSPGGILAYHNESGYLRICHPIEKRYVGGKRRLGFCYSIINDNETHLLCQKRGTHFYRVNLNTLTRSGFLPHTFGRLLNVTSDDDRCILFEKDSIYTIATVKHEMNKPPYLLFSFKLPISDIFEESFHFLRIDDVLHLQFVTRSGILMRYRMDEVASSWREV